MEENKKCSDSLRANGAFAAPSYRIEERQFQFPDTQEPSDKTILIYEYIENVYSKFLETIKYNIGHFNEKMIQETGYLQENLIKMLANIQQGKYNEALKMAKEEIDKGERGGYSNNGHDIYLHILNRKPQ